MTSPVELTVGDSAEKATASRTPVMPRQRHCHCKTKLQSRKGIVTAPKYVMPLGDCGNLKMARTDGTVAKPVRSTSTRPPLWPSLLLYRALIGSRSCTVDGRSGAVAKKSSESWSSFALRHRRVATSGSIDVQPTVGTVMSSNWSMVAGQANVPLLSCGRSSKRKRDGRQDRARGNHHGFAEGEFESEAASFNSLLGSSMTWRCRPWAR